MRKRAHISLLALVGAVLVTLVVAGPGSSGVGNATMGVGNTALTLGADPTSLYYGQSTSLSGDLTYTNPDTGDTFGVPAVDIQIQNSEGIGVTEASTNGDGNYSVTWWPVAAGSPTIQAYFAGTVVYDSAYSSYPGVGLTVELAPTQTSITNTPPTLIGLGDSFRINYKVESSYGRAGTYTGGSVSIDETSDLGTLGCTTVEIPLTAQTNSGFSATGTLICTPSAIGSYSYHLDYGGEDNYAGSDSGEDKTMTVATPLYNQNNNPLNPIDAWASFVGYDSNAADDFWVPTPMSWHITSVYVPGEDGFGNFPTAVSELTVRVYPDSAGLPGSTPVYTASVPAGSFTDVPGAFASTAWGGNLTIPVDVTLSPGHYWLSVQGTTGGWFWQLRGISSNTGAVWQDYSAVWEDLATRAGATPGSLDYLFTLSGTMVKANQPTLSVTGPESATFAAPDETIITEGGDGTGAITFDVGNSSACSIVSGKLHVTAASGTCTITATKAGDANYNPATSIPFTVSITNSYAGTAGTKTCVKDTLRGEETEHNSLKAAATAHGFASATALRKDITTYCKTLN